MCMVSEMPHMWAEEDKRSEADSFAEALKRLKPEEKFCAYDTGYNDGYKAAEEKILKSMEVPTRVCAKLTEENAELRRQLQVQADQIQKLRECIRRSQEDDWCE